MNHILLIVCCLPLWVSCYYPPNFFVPRCHPLIDCKEYYTVAGFAKVTWLEANFICNRVGAVLATSRNEEQHQLIIDYIKLDKRVAGNKTFWLGGTNRLYPPYSWTWLSTGQNITYAQWAKDEPRSDQTEEDACLLLGDDFLWHSAPCENKNYFICENICSLSSTQISKHVYI